MFRFRLEKVLRFRRRQVEAAGRALAAAAAEVVRTQGQVAATRRLIAGQIEAAAVDRAAQPDPRRMRDQGAWLEHLREQERRDAAQLAVAVAAREEARQRLVAAHRDQEVLEKLRQRQQEQWQLEERRTDQRRLDEVASVRSALARQVESAGRE
jgi:flagellar export protein FliJ